MYQSFYELAEMPFNITPDPKFLYLSPTHYEALQHLLYGIRERNGFIVLIGQPELKAVLARDELRQLRQRILVHYELHPLARADVESYIHHRLALAGNSGRIQFTPRAIRKIYRASKGVPRLVNNLCDK